MAGTTTVDNPEMRRYYGGVPPEQVRRLVDFRARYPYRHVTHDGLDWPYIVAGEGETSILLLPGAFGTAESLWQQIGPLAATRRVMAPSYPAVKTMAALVGGIAAVLQQEAAGAVHVVGASYGGIVAQVFVRRHRDLARRLVLSHTMFPDPARGRQLVRVLKMLAWLPEPLVKALFKRSMDRLMPADNPESALLRAYSAETLDRHLSKRLLIEGYRRVSDFDLHYTFVPTDLDDWPGTILLIMADDDRATPPPVRAEMERLYPRGRVHLFSGTGHAASVLRRDEYLGLIRDFTAPVAAEASQP